MHGMKWFFSLLSLHQSETCGLLSAVTWMLYASILFSHVEGQGDFLSIDCGSTSSNELDNIQWVPDGTYISAGENAIVKDAQRPYDTLRYFPGNETKNCYVLPTKTNLSYLVRAGFMYGKYDNSTEKSLPTFELLFDATHWATVNFSGESNATVYEMVVAAVSNSLSICLARTNTSSSIPFISSLEIRPLLSSDQNLYSSVHKKHFLMTNSRINFGQNTSVSIRYPEDQFDRIWESDSVAIENIATYGIVSTNRNIRNSNTLDIPPSAVMQTARIANGSNNMTFTFRAKFGSGDYYLALYFAEINSSAQRISDLYLNQVLAFNLNMSQFGVFDSTEIFNPSFSVTGDSYNLVLKKNASSNSEPIINAAESYILKQVELQTDDQDVRALSDVKTHFNLSVWNGDPCLPVSYKWSWLLCNISNVPRVTTLNLSGMDLKGEIPASIANLTALTVLDLHDNNLQGIIPSSFVNLPNLLKLDLRNNNLSGELPSFRSTVTINVSGNPFLCTTVDCGVALAPKSNLSPLPSRSGKNLLKILVGAGIAFAVTIIVSLAIYRWKFLGRKRFLMANSGHWPPIPPTTEFRRVADPVLSPRKESANHLSKYTFTDIRAITNNFERELAGGCSGSVHYGVLPSGQEVVVKLLQSKYQRLQSEFQIMVERFCLVHHKNILSPIGYCDEYHRQLFVYEYMQKGTLYDQLNDQELLDWKTRLNILLQVAQGLEYLHFACSPGIIHGNVRSKNVLLNNLMVAKVSDFAFHELLPDGDKGAPDATSGYLDPEYFRLNKLTKESDVYSLGVLILEVVCGRIPFDTSLQKEQWNIVEWVRWTVQKGNYELVVDPSLEGCYNGSSLSKVVQVAVQSVEAIATDRPTMSEIVMELKEAHKIEMGHHVAFAAPSIVDNDLSSFPSMDYDAKL